ncbi:PKD domain-containing protein [Leifsonia sp. NPDC058248]|uniref:PKD domain-containing protein n=1 Tax=Leifsonia sp. NPDC058248 TaxID=3346402 RepID=UPI0036D8E844
MSTELRPRARSLGILTAVVTTVGLVFGGLALASPASADTAPPDPTNPASPPTVAADPLPTTQIDGVAWAQVVVGNTVYVAGKFTTARPAGAAAGTNTTPRSNLLAYDITTGNLISSFDVPLNAQALAITASPDGSRVYVGGDFTTAGTGNYYRIVAISTATGQVISSFRPIMESQVRSLAATNTAVYAGGTFSSVNGTSHTYVAKINASDGSLDASWTPTADAAVDALAVSPDGSKVYIGGRFQNVSGSAHYGLAMASGTDGTLLPFAVNSVVRDAGTQAGITALVATDDRVYGSGYVFGAGGNLEGSFSADPDGNLLWMEDCHGDTYSIHPLGDALYAAGHPHYCGNVGGFPQTNPWTYHHTIAFSKAATGTLTNNGDGAYANFTGRPSPTLLNWYPDYVTGSYTGQGQAAWSISGNSQYLAVGGEFPFVNGIAQYGLTRYAVNTVVKSKVAPNINTSLVPNAASFAAGQARISWTSTFDRDNVNLNYKLVRDGNLANPVYQTNQISNFWTRPAMGYIDNGLVPGSTHSYRLYVTDPDGNQVSRLGNTVTISATDSGGAYADSVKTAGATSYWPLDEASGTAGFDHIGFNDLQVQAGVTRGAAGPVTGVTASTFNGTSTGWAVTPSSIPGPNTFTVGAWFKTTTTSGGKIIGFGNANVGTSSGYDRHVYMDNSGKIWFGVYPGGVRTVNSSASYNNGQWHQVVASLGSNGMRLYVDGKVVGSRTDVTTGQDYAGYWRVGGDNLGSWTSQPSSNFFAGDIGQVAIYPTVLDRSVVVNQYMATGRPSPLAPAPADAYGAAVYNSNPDLFWRLDETSGSTANSADAYTSNGTYSGTATTKNQTGVLPGNADKAVRFNTNFSGSSGGIVTSNQLVSNPTTYSEEIWFKTTTTKGGKLIGFGDAKTGLSGSYDRHVYMQDDGRIVFGTWTGQANTITSPNPLNNNAWHHAVATQAGDGMKLYVDGVLVGTNPQTQAQAYDGYWRIGGDNTWGSTGPYFSGTLDEAAVYSSELSAQDVANHYSLATSGTLPNQAPTANFTSSQDGLTVNVDGSTSTDSDGTIASYAWDFGDGGTATTATASHVYGQDGTYAVKLTVTDNQGVTGTKTTSVTVAAPPPNQAPVAAFTSAVTNLSVAFDASGSADPDGTVASYAWDFGDGSTGTGVNPTHVYGSAGTFTVSLTVTDGQGLAGTAVTHDVTTVLPPNQLPTASFTATPNGLAVGVDGTASNDPDGTIASYAWDFGDGGTATTSTANHTYATGGTYPVQLTVTDNRGGTNTATKSVTVTAPPPAAIASDTFERTSASGWGSSDLGGAWTGAGAASAYTVGSGTASIVGIAGSTKTELLGSVSSTNTDTTVQFRLDKTSTGGGLYVSAIGRSIGTAEYSARVWMQSSNVVQLQLLQGSTALKALNITGLTYVPGQQYQVRLQVFGTNPTTVRARVWTGATEPTTWQASVTDTTAALQAAGSVGLRAFLSGTATDAPLTTKFDNFVVTPAQ